MFRSYLSSPQRHHATSVPQKALVPHEKALVPREKALVPREKALLLQKAFVTHEKALPQRAHTPDRQQHRTCYRYRNHRRAATYLQAR